MMANKLGQQVSEVRKYLYEQNQFVCTIYKKMIDEQYSSKIPETTYQQDGSISAKGIIQPSFIPSIVSSLNQTHILSGQHCFSNTQPIPFKSHLGGDNKSSENPSER